MLVYSSGNSAEKEKALQNNTNQTRNSAKTNDQTGSNTTKPHYEHLMRKTGHMDRFLASIRASR